MVYMLLAEGFEEIEAVYPIDVLRRCGVEITTVAVCNDSVKGEYINGSHGIIIKADIRIDEVVLDDNIDMLILPGGSGRVNLAENSRSLELIKHCYEYKIPIAAICGAPEILGERGYLKGKKATCYPGLEDNLIGAQYVKQTVVVDGSIITSQAAGTSEAFAFAIAEHLCGKEKTDEIFGKMLCVKKHN